VSARTEPRFTRGADLAVPVEDDADAERLVESLQQRGWAIAAAIEQEAAGRLAAVRLAPYGEAAHGVVIDLLFASSGIEPEVVQAAETVEVLPGLVVPIARLGHLIALKVLARDDRTRPQDAADLARLLSVADSASLALARDALALVRARGFHRGRDLAGDLDGALRQFRPGHDVPRP
jgi:predicted nucleotidyltransferase